MRGFAYGSSDESSYRTQQSEEEWSWFVERDQCQGNFPEVRGLLNGGEPKECSKRKYPRKRQRLSEAVH